MTISICLVSKDWHLKVKIYNNGVNVEYSWRKDGDGVVLLMREQKNWG